MSITLSNVQRILECLGKLLSHAVIPDPCLHFIKSNMAVEFPESFRSWKTPQTIPDFPLGMALNRSHDIGPALTWRGQNTQGLHTCIWSQQNDSTSIASLHQHAPTPSVHAPTLEHKLQQELLAQTRWQRGHAK